METIIIYNPRLFDGKPSKDIKDYPELGKKWNLKVNSIGKFPSQVAQKLLKTFGFLREVKPEELSAIDKEINAKLFQCEHCEKLFSSEAQLKGHMMGKHKMTKEVEEMLKSIPDAVGEDVPTANVAQSKPMTIEQEEGIDGSGWVGGGLETDGPSSMNTRRPGQPGYFN